MSFGHFKNVEPFFPFALNLSKNEEIIEEMISKFWKIM